MPTQIEQIGNSCMSALETSESPVESDGRFRPPLKVRFQKTLTLLQLAAATTFGITTNQTRHKLGLSHPAPPHQKIPLPFFSLLPTLPIERPTIPG
jgi:hypothetical protein